MFQFAVTAGLRVSEFTALQVVTSIWAWVRTCSATAKAARTEPHPWTGRPYKSSKAFTTEQPSDAEGFVFPTRTGTQMSRDAVAARLTCTPRPPRCPARA